ncbi:MAG: group 1 truncated hemoglobin [Labilithrix sp.]|nr:group 1 truncated hemoglobin [Labilithrix sp.]MCW5816061.1 group 1 truncated hemoglobin [Labilithrix sp.]
MRASSVYAVILVSAGLAVFACASKPPPPKEPAHTETVADAGEDADAEPPPPKSLYERLGKQDGITKVVDVLVKNLQADPKFKGRMATLKGAKLDKFKKDLADQVCVESGGPDAGADCKYEGRFMKELLGPKNKLKEEEWNAMLLELRNSFEENKIEEAEQADLTAEISKFRDDVVQAAPVKK